MKFSNMCAVLTLSIFSLFSKATSQEMDLSKTLSPYFQLEPGPNSTTEHFPLKSTDVDVKISGTIAEVVVKQKYANEGSTPINGQYLFPASTRAAVHGMTMTIGDEIISAKIKKREQAKLEFEAAKAEGKNASLLEQQRPNVFSMKVSNIMPEDELLIELRYTEHLEVNEGVYEFVYPTVVGPRYSNKPEEGATDTDKWVKNPYLKNGTDPHTSFDIHVKVNSPIPIFDFNCLSHKTDVNWTGNNSASLNLKAPSDFGDNRDFILQYRLEGEQIQSGLMLYEGEEENFFLLMAQPPKRVSQGDIPPREYIFVVDVSGSMHGFPLNTAKELLRDLVGRLRPTDRFNVILFAGASNTLADHSLSADQTNIDRAIRVIDSQQGGGGTEIVPALQSALALPRAEGFSRSIVVITDGYISAEEELFSLVQEHIGDANVFSFGIGSSVNRFLIEGLAKAGAGEAFVVTDQERAHIEASRFRRYIESPVLTSIKLTSHGFDIYDMEPSAFADMLAERPIMVIGKWRGNPKGTLTVSGVSGSGNYSQPFDVSQNKPQESNSPLKYLWARSRISTLSDFAINQSDDQVQEVTSLGLTYNLLTKYTSFIAVSERTRNPSGESKDVKQPLPMPQHVSDLAVGGGVHKTPEPSLAVLIILLTAAYILKKKAFGKTTTMEI